MKLLLDQCVPRTTVEHLKNMGIISFHCADCGLAQASDTEILHYARSKELVIATLDADFSHILALSNAVQPSVIRVREEGLTAHPFAKLIKAVINRCEPEIESGAIVSATTESIRLRPLPINP